MAYGVPVVVTDVGALGESVKEWKVGEVVEPGNPIALVQAIRRLHTPEPYQKALEAINRLKSELSWEKTARTTIEVYKRVLGESNG